MLQLESRTICNWRKHIYKHCGGSVAPGMQQLVEEVDAGLRSIYNAVALQGNLTDEQFQKGIDERVDRIKKAIQNARIEKHSDEMDMLQDVVERWNESFRENSQRWKNDAKTAAVFRAAMVVFERINDFCIGKRSGTDRGGEARSKRAVHRHTHGEGYPDAMDTSASAADCSKLMQRCQRCNLLIAATSKWGFYQ